MDDHRETSFINDLDVFGTKCVGETQSHILLYIYTVIVICGVKRSKAGSVSGEGGDHWIFCIHSPPHRRPRHHHHTHASFLLYRHIYTRKHIHIYEKRQWRTCTMGECVLSFVALLSGYFYGTRVPRLPFTREKYEKHRKPPIWWTRRAMHFLFQRLKRPLSQPLLYQTR